MSATPPMMWTTTGRMSAPASIAASLIWFHAIFTLDALSSYRLFASVASALEAVFSSHASLPSFKDSVSRSPDAASASMTWASSVPFMPMSLRVCVVAPPSVLTREMPCATRSRACTGEDLNFAENSSADTPAVAANASRDLPPDSTEAFIFSRTRVVTPPPSSAFTPIEDRVLDRANTSASVAPTVAPAPEMRCAMARMSASVDAPALPSATRAPPNRSTPSVPSRSIVPMTFEI